MDPKTIKNTKKQNLEEVKEQSVEMLEDNFSSPPRGDNCKCSCVGGCNCVGRCCDYSPPYSSESNKTSTYTLSNE